MRYPACLAHNNITKFEQWRIFNYIFLTKIILRQIPEELCKFFQLNILHQVLPFKWKCTTATSSQNKLWFSPILLGASVPTLRRPCRKAGQSIKCFKGHHQNKQMYLKFTFVHLLYYLGPGLKSTER
jgi:hypothetical protein